jgi:hypothetical protein
VRERFLILVAADHMGSMTEEEFRVPPTPQGSIENLLALERLHRLEDFVSENGFVVKVHAEGGDGGTLQTGTPGAAPSGPPWILPPRRKNQSGQRRAGTPEGGSRTGSVREIEPWLDWDDHRKKLAKTYCEY